MKKITMILAFGLITFIGNAQTFQWAKQIAGTGVFDVQVVDVLPISNGHSIAVGSFSGTVDFDTSSSVLNKTSQGIDGFVAQYDSGGNLLWVYTTNLSGNEKVSAAALTFSTIDLVIAIGTNSFNITRLNFDGTLFGSSSSYSSTGVVNVNCISKSPAGFPFYIGGSFTGSLTISGTTLVSNGQLDGFVAKFSPVSGQPQLTFEWVVNYGGTGNDQVNDISFNGTSITGYFEGLADFDTNPSTSPATSTITETSAGGKDIFFMLLDTSSGLPNGGANGVSSIGGTGNDEAKTIVQSGADTFLGGYFSGTLPINPGNSISDLVSAGLKDGFVAKINIVPYSHYWSKKIGGTNDDEVIDLDQTGSTDVVYAAKLGSSSGSATTLGGFNTSNGNASTFGGILLPNNQTTLNQPFSIAIGNGAYFSTGIFNATTDFNPQAGTASIAPVSGGNNGFIHKISNCLLSAGTPTISGNSTVCSGQSTTLTVGNSATLNNNNDWKWYSGSCGGTLVGTGLTITVTPTATTSYYVRGEGGCVANGPCSLVKTITLAAFPDSGVNLLGNTLTAEETGASYQWIDCNNGNANIPGATNISYTPIASGNYAVVITNSSGCSVTSSCTQITVCNPAGSPQVSGTSGISCPNQSRTLTANGNLNNSTAWRWYTGSCGGTLIGTGTSITVSPAVTTDYFCRGEGGCTTNGVCTSVTVNVGSLPNNAVTLSGNTLTATQSGATYQWVDCNNGNSNIAGATSQSYTPTVSGNYAVKITSAAGCLATSACTQLLSNNEFEQLGIKLYPNPIKNIFTIEGEIVIEKLAVYNLLGQKVKVFAVNESSYDISELASGTYIIEVLTDKGTARTKIIKD